MKVLEENAEISIFDEIGGWFGVEVSQFKKDFDKIKNKKSIKVLINSPGGNVFDGMAIYNILAAYKSKITTEIVGIAASIASLIALAGKTRNICQGTYFMIHDPSGFCLGNAADMRKMAEDLEKIAGQIANIYARNSVLEKEDILQKMHDETWFTAEEAVEAGFADTVVDYGEIAALAFDISQFHYTKIPESIKQFTGKAIPTREDEKSIESGTLIELEKQNIELTENVKDLEANIEIQEEKISLLLSEKQELARELADLKAEKFKAEKAQAIEKALSEGRIIPRNRDRWEKLFDMNPEETKRLLAEQAPVVDFKVYGTGAGGKETEFDESIDPAIAKQLGLTDEEIRKYNREQRKS